MAEIKFTEGHRQRLRKRYLQGGIDAIQDYELLELVLTYAIPRKDVKPTAKMLLQSFGSLSGVFNASVSELKRISGIGESAALLLTLFRHVALIMLENKLRTPSHDLCSKELMEYLYMLFDHPEREMGAILLYDSDGSMIFSTMFEGITGSVQILAREIVTCACEHKATSVVMVHNHPGGNLFFSKEDLNATLAVETALNLFNIELYDHILISGNRNFSWRKGY